MSESLCGYCFKEYAPSCCEKSEYENLKRQLAEAREDARKAFDWALNITDDDFNSRDYAEDDTNKIKNILWEEYKEQNQ